jgi:hypothetical protein
VTEQLDDDLPSAPDIDANEADAQEQAETVDDTEQRLQPSSSVEVDEFDAAEQSRTVELDPDEYR